MGLVVFTPDFKVTFRMIANRAFLWGFAALVHVSAVSAFPLYHGVFFEDSILFNVCQQFQIASFMVAFDFGNLTERSRNFWKAFFFGCAGEVGI